MIIHWVKNVNSLWTKPILMPQTAVSSMYEWVDDNIGQVKLRCVDDIEKTQSLYEFVLWWRMKNNQKYLEGHKTKYYLWELNKLTME